MADPITALFQPTLEAEWVDLQFISADQLQLPTTDWGTYSPERNIIILTSRMLEVLGVACVERYRGMFLTYSEGETLTILAEETYRTPRLPATFATCYGQFSNDSASTYTIPSGDYVTVKKSTSDEVTYRIDGPVSIVPGATPLPGVVARATLAGSIGSANAGEINEIEGQVLPGVTFANITVATGRDVEPDGDLRTRARLAITALSVAGPLGAYEYFAKGGERNGAIDLTIAAIGVNRVVTLADAETGGARCYYATPSGALAGGDVEAINNKLLLRVVPVGMTFAGASATPVIIDVDYIAWVMEDLGVDEIELKAAILTRLIAYFEAARIGGYPEIIPTAGFTGALTTSKMRGLVTDIELNGIRPVHDGVLSLNTLGEILFTEEQVPVLGVVTGSVVYQTAQEA